MCKLTFIFGAVDLSEEFSHAATSIGRRRKHGWNGNVPLQTPEYYEKERPNLTITPKKRLSVSLSDTLHRLQEKTFM